MNIKNALATEGWMKPSELEWLAEKASTLRTINVKANIRKPLVRPGGLHCDHDRGHPLIFQAVRELLGTQKSSSIIWYARIGG